MDETLPQILDACNLARELEAELATLQNYPHHLLMSCAKVAGAFNKAIHSMQSSYPSPIVDEGSSHGRSGGMREANIPCPQALEEANNPLLGRGAEETTALDPTQLGLYIQMPEAMAAAITETPGVPGHTGGPQTEVRPFRRSRAETEGPSGRARRPAGSSRRSYYRCTHRKFYGCEATKRLQRLDDDPYTYEVTYCGNHTCLTSTAPFLMPALPLPTTTTTTIATTMTTTIPTAYFAGGGPSMDNPEGPTAASLAEAMMITGQAPPLSTSIQLGSWLTRGLEGGSSHAGASHTQGGGGRDAECTVADLADTMFNSGSSGSSMDAIFRSTGQDN